MSAVDRYENGPAFDILASLRFQPAKKLAEYIPLLIQVKTDTQHAEEEALKSHK